MFAAIKNPVFTLHDNPDCSVLFVSKGSDDRVGNVEDDLSQVIFLDFSYTFSQFFLNLIPYLIYG